MDKLKNFGPVYLINLKDHSHRLENAIRQFKRYGIKDYNIIEAIDGRNSDLSNIVFGKYPNLKSSEIGCITSHIKALNYWLTTSDSEYAIILEDDFSFDTVPHWQWDWDYVVNNIPDSADIVQFIMIKNDPVTFSIHKKDKFDRSNIMSYEWSTACYLIKRSYAQKLVDLHYVDGKYRLSNHGYRNQAADVILYSLGEAYSMPLFTHMLDLKNSINHNHSDFHIRSKTNIDNWWEKNAGKYTKEQFFDLVHGLNIKPAKKKGCFKIFHDEKNNGTIEKRDILTKRAVEELNKNFTAIDTPTIMIRSVEDVKSFYKNRKIKIDPMGHFGDGWKPGELGIWASNYTAWEKFLSTDYDYLILMEDDILLGKDFNNKLINYLNELPDDWDVFTAYIPETGNIRYNKKKNSLFIGKQNVCKVYQSWSCLCYVVSRKGAERLINEVSKGVKSPIDHYLFYHESLNVYTMKMERGNICSIYKTESTVQNAQRFDMTGYV